MLKTVCNMDAVAADAAVFDGNGACLLGRLSLDLWKREEADFLEVHTLPFSIEGQVAATSFADAFEVNFPDDSLGMAMKLTSDADT